MTTSQLCLEKYSKVIEILDLNPQMNLTELTCLIISHFFINKKEFDRIYKERLNKYPVDDITLKYLNTLSLFLKKPDKKYLTKLETNLIMAPMQKIFKKMLSSKIEDKID
mgnify:CR=1 FL=1